MDVTLGLLVMLLDLIAILWLASKHPRVAGPLIVGFVLRAGVVLLDVFVQALPGADDGYGWHRVATYWARTGLTGTFEHIGTGHQLYMWMMSVLYAAFAPSRFMIQGVNLFFGTLIVFGVWRIAELLAQDPVRARKAAWLAAVFPSLIFFSAVLMREVAVSCPLTMCLLYLVRWYRERKNSQLVMSMLMLLVSMAFHSGGLAVLLFAGLWLIGSWLRALISMRSRNLWKSSLALAVGLAVVGSVLSSGFGLQKFRGLESGDVDVLTERQDGFAIGRAAYLGDLHANSPSQVLVQAPIRTIYFLFAPFPWMLSSASDAFGIVDSLMIFILIVRAARNRKALADNPAAMMVLGVFGAMSVVFAIGVSNYGTALRHRSKMLPLLIAASVTIPARRKRQERNGIRIQPILQSQRSA